MYNICVFAGTSVSRRLVEFLDGTDGSILLTTGSRELSACKIIHNFSERAYARVLPMEDSLHLCPKAGLMPAHIFAI